MVLDQEDSLTTKDPLTTINTTLETMFERSLSCVAKGLTMGIIPMSAGVCIGLLDGRGTPLDPDLKYAILVAPTAFNAFYASIGLSKNALVGWSARKLLRERPASVEAAAENLHYNDEQRAEFKQAIQTAAEYHFDTLALTKAVARPALKTSLGYATGYALAHFLG